MQRMQSDQATTVNSTFAESRIADKSSRGLFGEHFEKRFPISLRDWATGREARNSLRTERLVDKVLAEEQDGVRSRRAVLIKLVSLHIQDRHHLGLERYRRLQVFDRALEIEVTLREQARLLFSRGGEVGRVEIGILLLLLLLHSEAVQHHHGHARVAAQFGRGCGVVSALDDHFSDRFRQRAEEALVEGVVFEGIPGQPEVYLSDMKPHTHKRRDRPSAALLRRWRPGESVCLGQRSPVTVAPCASGR